MMGGQTITATGLCALPIASPIALSACPHLTWQKGLICPSVARRFCVPTEPFPRAAAGRLIQIDLQRRRLDARSDGPEHDDFASVGVAKSSTHGGSLPVAPINIITPTPSSFPSMARKGNGRIDGGRP